MYLLEEVSGTQSRITLKHKCNCNHISTDMRHENKLLKGGSDCLHDHSRPVAVHGIMTSSPVSAHARALAVPS